MGSLAEIKAAIGNLPDEEKAALASWFAEIDREAWDSQIATDFSPGGAGMRLLEQVDREIDAGKFKPLG